MAKLSPQPIVILGTFRSGTSALATALNSMGVYFGAERDFYPANEFNPGGFWELKDQQVLNAQILNVFGMNFYQVDRLPEGWADIPGGLAAVNQVRSFLHTHFEGRARWGWKEPATSVLMPIYKAACEAEGLDPVYAVSVRHPLSVAASQRRRQSDWGYKEAVESGAKDVVPVEDRTLGLWVQFTLASLKETHGKPRAIVSYEDFLRDPRQSLDALANLITDWQPSEDEINAAVGTVNPEWSHSKYTLDDLDEWPSIIRRVYEMCLRASQSPRALSEGQFDSEIDALWDEWMLLTKMMRPIALQPDEIKLNWKAGGEPNSASFPTVPSGGWQTMRIPVSAPPGTTILLDPYPAPCQVWIRKSVWHVGAESKAAPFHPGPGGVVENLGVSRVNCFGPGAILLKSPGPSELEIEMMVTAGTAVSSQIVGMLQSKLDQLRRGNMPAPGRR